MRRDSGLAERQRTDHLEQVRVTIGRVLRASYDTEQPLPESLDELVSQIERRVDAIAQPKP